MGQQQLLLLVLSAIIVGIAIVVGINLFSEGAVQANQDAVTQDVATIGARAQEWYRKPKELGGGGHSFTGLTLAELNIDSTNANGTFSVAVTASDVAVTGIGTEDGDGDGTNLTVTATYDSSGVKTPLAVTNH